MVECNLETGRTHQIRVHLKHKGTSILGDNTYGKKIQNLGKVNEKFLTALSNLNGQALHAQTLEFTHPTKKNKVKFKTNLPYDFKKMLDLLDNLTS